MPEDGQYKEVTFKTDADVWPIVPEGNPYIDVRYDPIDATFSLTIHPNTSPIDINCFTQNHVVIALRDAGFSYPQINKILNDAYLMGKKVG